MLSSHKNSTSKPVSQAIPGFSSNRDALKSKYIPSKSRVFTYEYYIYYLITLIVVPFMLYQGWVISSPSHPIYSQYKHKLSDGWIFGRKVDLSDSQWSTFRNNVPILSIVMLFFVLLNKLTIRYNKKLPGNLAASTFTNKLERFSSASNSISISYQKQFSLRHDNNLLICGMALFSLIFFIFVFGFSTIFILSIMSLNYLLTKKVFAGSKHAFVAIFGFNMLILFTNEIFSGYLFASISPSLAWMDLHRGMMRRWDTTFNITMLRMVSFSLDYHWKLLQTPILGVSKMNHLATSSDLNDKQRIEYSRLESEYSFLNYFVYLSYVPLYLTGPIITFNDFTYQLKNRKTNSMSISARKYSYLYLIRLLASFLVMELLLHIVHPIAISDVRAFDLLSPLQISLVGYFYLTFIWLKLLLIWRLARCFSLFDNLMVIENMGRCMSNNYSLSEFWKNWHCSYNRFLVRYFYKPLIALNYGILFPTAIIFLFVAVWHDLSLRLLAWAWLIILLFIPELGMKFLFSKVFKITSQTYPKTFRYFVSFGGSINIFAMIIANLVGFGVGVDGMELMIIRIFSVEGLPFVLTTLFLLNIHVLNMYELRQAEFRRKLARSD
ncbi:Glycerol uptake protein 1 [Smittium culicis]|uniref:Glycerol uptake protein 1 n=1 Tax=Smittium culicis TaxID=133412 RepID=A0A1R1Y8F5_9FUNG|nr:Glycerol uptake protein 1 [Smittium culicis]